MSETLFDIVFKGKFVSQIDQPKAILRFSKLFKVPIEKAKFFFDGNPRPLKKSLNLEKASQFREALKKSGLRVSMVKQISDNKVNKYASFTLSKLGAILAVKAFIQPIFFKTSQFTLDEVGAQMVSKDDFKEIEFDIDDIILDEIGAIMAEKVEVPNLDVDISDLSMGELGTIFSEKEIIAEPEFNLSAMNMEEVGSILVEKEVIPEPEINIDYIKMVD